MHSYKRLVQTWPSLYLKWSYFIFLKLRNGEGDTLVTCLITGTKYLRKQLKGGKGFSSALPFGCIVHQGAGEVTNRVASSQEAGEDQCWLSALSLISIQPWNGDAR